MNIDKLIINEGAMLLCSFIRDAKSICIVGHIDPDGDCIASILTLKEFIETATTDDLKRDIKTVFSGKIPYNYDHLMYLNCDKIDESYTCDLMIAVDCCDEKRMGEYQRLIKKTEFLVNIDHHIYNSGFGQLNIVLPKSCATGEVLYRVFKSLGVNLSKSMMRNIYIAVLTDSGKFLYENTNALSHEIAIEAIKKGIDIFDIGRKIYCRKPPELMNAFVKCISTMNFYYENKIVTVKVRKKDIEGCRISIEEFDGIVDVLREIDTLDVYCVLKEYDKDNTKISIRSDNIDVGKISMIFGGGGHRESGGFFIEKNIYEAEVELVNYLELNLTKETNFELPIENTEKL